MERDKRRTSISSKSKHPRSTTTSNVNLNKFVRQSIDYSGVDSDALSEIIKHEDEANNDVINTSHLSKEGPTSNKIQCSSNQNPNVIDINKSTKDAYRRSILELPGAESNRSLSPPLANVSRSQTVSVSNREHTSNSVQNNDISCKGSRSSIHHETNKKHKSDKNVAIPETRGREIISAKDKTNESRKRRHRSRSHSTDSRRRKKIRSSTNCVGNAKHKQQSSRNDKYPDGKTTCSVGRQDKSPVRRFHGRDRRDTHFDRNIDRKGTQSPRSAAYRERSPLRHSHEHKKGHVSRIHASHRSAINKADLHLSSNQNYDLRRENNPTFDNRSRSNVDINTEYDRNVQRAHELERNHELNWHGAFSNSYDDLGHQQHPTFDRTPRLNDDFNSEYYRNSQRTDESESNFENIWQGMSSDWNYDNCHEQNHTFDGRYRSNYDINTEYDNNSITSYEIESQHETPLHRLSSNRNCELFREQNPKLDRRSRLNSDINTEYDRNTERPYEIESRHDITKPTVIPNRNYEPYRGHTSSLDKRSRSNVDTEYDRNIKGTHENINRTISNKETYECRSISKLNVASKMQYPSERQNFRQNAKNRFQKIDLEKLSKMDTDSLAAHLSTYRKELDTYLFEDLGREQMSLLLHVMCQLCECKRKLLVQKALNPLKERRFFDRQDIKNIIYELRVQFDEEKIQILTNLLVLMKGLVYYVNTGPADLITSLDSLERCVNEKLKDENHQRDLKAVIQQIRDKWDSGTILCNENRLSTLAILPDLIEIESFASSSIDSEYETEESYLRRLFMVHRQDFIRPLCKGLMSLKNALFEDPYCLERKWRQDDIRVYKNIVFLSRCCNEQTGITWKIRFDTTPYSRINWNTRKLLTFGSLVCLTNRTFTILQYATVADRNVGDLKNGIFQIKFVNDIEEESEILQEPGVLLIESQAFFPSYFHTLKSLKSMHSEIVNAENSLPFGKQLFKKKHSVEQDKPDYFKSSSFVEGFDIRCLNSEQKAKVDISNESNWPDADNLCMDNSQHRAFTTAIKSKLALIQGPPGTGKTVVGLKLAELLLRNKHIWRQHDNQGPMLLLSYTNHALDQFLLDISKRLRITDAADIVRLGGRSENEKLSKYNLAAKRKAYSYKQEEFVTRKGAVHTHTIRESSSELNVIAFNSRKKLKTILSEHETLQKLRDQIQSGIVHQEWLYDVAGVITDTHYRTLRGNYSLINWLNLESISQFVTTQQNHVAEIYEDDDFDYFDYEDNRYDDQNDDYDEEGIETTATVSNTHLDLQKLKMLVSSDIVFNLQRIHRQRWFWDQYNMKVKSVFIETIKEKLFHTKEMRTVEANSVSNIWYLPNVTRWRLYKYWVQQALIPINKEIQDCEEYYKTAQECYENNQQIADINILKRAKLVACTTTRAARDIEILKRVSPSIVILEEAAEIPEHHVVACLTSSCQQLIMIGDHQQLRPSYNDYKTAKEHKIDVSLFERLIREGFPFTRLEYQHRMTPLISKLFVPHIYRTLIDDPSVFQYENVKGTNRNMFFLSHSIFEDEEREELSRSHKNTFEAMFICKLYRYLRMQGYPSSKITVLSTYLDQVRLLFNKIRTEEENISTNNVLIDDFVNYQGISNGRDRPSARVTAVDNFQGEENDIILLSLVRSNRENKIGHLFEANRICVALSRAKIGLYVVGNFKLLTSRSVLWKNIVSYADEEKCFGTELQLRCQNHQNSTYVSKPDDFDKVADGGCQEACEIKRQCGHFCLRKCHVDDPDHKGICPKQCHREMCELKHKCIKPCHFPVSCGKCNERVEKTIPKCQHRKLMPCHEDPQSASCDERCKAKISCGHRCQKHCTDPCNTEDDCNELVKINARCGHEVQVACNTKYDAPCKLPCNGILKCGHECRGTHSECSQGRLHVPCRAKCERNLVCGHICEDYCSYRCPPCTQKCDRRCIHGDRCKNLCSNSCIPCTELCKWACTAKCPNKFRCEQVCIEPCKRPKCNTICDTILDCGIGHKCSGLLCERSKCICKVCDKLTDIYLGYEDEDNAMFIRLEDCRCVLEVKGLDQYISTVMDNISNEIKPLKCPKCNTKISRSKRYSNELKIINKNICEVFRTIRNIEEGTDLHAKRFTTIQLLTKYEIDMPTNIYTKLKEKVKCTRSIDSLNMVVDQLTFYEEIFSLRIEIFSFECRRFLQAWLDRLEKWVFLRRSRYARQEHNEFYLEIRRLQLTLDIHEFKTELSKKAEEKALPDNILNHLLKLESTKVMDDEELSKIRKETEEVSSKMIGLTLKEKQMIKRAMEKEFMGSGHWYKCKNEHYYSIGECGMPMEKIKCPQCGVPIGGADHILTDDNERAMDFENL